jgi:hypothetical protein
MAITATISRTCSRPPIVEPVRKPKNHKTTRIATIVHNMVQSGYAALKAHTSPRFHVYKLGDVEERTGIRLREHVGFLSMTTTTIRNRNGPFGGKHLHCVLALASLCLAGAAGAQEIRATVDGDLVSFNGAQPTMTNGRVMVPIRGVFEHMNASVEWDAISRAVIAQRGADSIRMPVNSSYATLNGRQVRLDSPATIQGGRMMVPLRFLSESLGAGVQWIEATRTVQIDTLSAGVTPPAVANYTVVRMAAGTVIPFELNDRLTSNDSVVGDRFTADLDTSGPAGDPASGDALIASLQTGGDSNYQGMTSGAVLEGHVDFASAKTGDTPGVLGLAFDRVRLADGKTVAIHGSLIGLDSKSVAYENGRLVAKPGAKNDNLKYVGYGAGAGALVAVLTKGNVISTTLIGAALGFLFGEIQKSPSKSRDVTSEQGTKFGVRLTRDLTFRVPNPEYSRSTSGP